MADWRISLIVGKRARYVGRVRANTEAEAIRKAAKSFSIPMAQRRHLVAAEFVTGEKPKS